MRLVPDRSPCRLLDRIDLLGLLDSGTWKAVLANKVRALDWKAVEQDICPFLERTEDILTFNKKNLLSLLSRTT